MKATESARIQVPEICERLNLGRRAVYALLEAKIIPNMRLGVRYLVGRSAYLEWEKHFGERPLANVVGINYNGSHDKNRSEVPN